MTTILAHLASYPASTLHARFAAQSFTQLCTQLSLAGLTQEQAIAVAGYLKKLVSWPEVSQQLEKKKV